MANIKVSINDGSEWKTFIALLKPGQRLIKKNINLVGCRCFPLKEESFFPGSNPVRFLLVCWLLEVADRIELAGLLIDFLAELST